MKKINLKGEPGKTYDLEEISSENTRLNKEEKLLVQVWKWNPNGVSGESEEHKFPNPPNPKVGQIWLSKLV